MEKYYKKYEWYYLIPVIFILTVVPLIVYLKVVPLKGVTYQFWNGQQNNYDFFSYYKMVWFLTAMVFSLIFLGIRSYQSDIGYVRKSIYYYPIIVYVVFVLLSTLFSKYKGIAMLGFTDRYEGMFVLLGYMAVLFVTINLVREEDDVKLLLGALITGAVIIGIIGALQYAGIDIWKSAFGKKLMLPKSYESQSNKLQFQFAKHTIYATMYHTDYVGSYMAMLFPLCFTIFMLCKNKILKVFMAFITLLMIVNWLGCNSRAGMVGGIAAVILLLVIIHKYIAKHYKYFIFGIAAIVIIFAGFNVVSKGYIGKRVNSLMSDAKSIFKANKIDKDSSEDVPLKDIVINGKKAQIVTSSGKLGFEIVGNGEIVFLDADNKVLTPKFDKATGKISLIDDKYKNYDITLGKMNNASVLVVQQGSIKLYFELSLSKITMIDNKGYEVKWGPVASAGFKGKEKLGSARGYIWSRAIPLLKHTVLFGYGPDTFAVHFPQNDLKGKLYAYGDMWMFVDKPHDIYLQSAINTGIISLIALIALFGMYFVKSVKMYFRCDYSKFTQIAGAAIFVAVFGYLIAGFFNDSIVSIAPVFWILLGLGIAVNQINKPEKNMKNIEKAKA